MIKHLFYKHPTNNSLLETDQLDVTESGIEGGTLCHPYRHLLIIPANTLEVFNIKKGSLKENIIIDWNIDIHTLPSGTIIKIGDVSIRLTFLCEPCSKIKHLVSLKKIIYKRGYLAQVLNSGTITKDSKISLDTSYSLEAIPYKLSDRIEWYLKKIDEPIFVQDLVQAIGLSPSYCRAVPNIIRNSSKIDKTKILYKNKPNSQLSLNLKE